MSLIVRVTAALWAALTNINADHRQSKLQLINNLLPHSRHCNINVAPWHSSLRHTQHSTPLYTRKRQKKMSRCCLKKKWWGEWGLRHNSLVLAFLVYLFHLLSLGLRHNSPARFLYDTLSHPIQLSHKLRVVVSPVPAACLLRPLDIQFLLTLREWHDQPTNKGRVSQPTNAAPLPFRAAA